MPGDATAVFMSKRREPSISISSARKVAITAFIHLACVNSFDLQYTTNLIYFNRTTFLNAVLTC